MTKSLVAATKNPVQHDAARARIDFVSSLSV